MTSVCLHCWHSDPNTHGVFRWFCCRPSCDERAWQTHLDTRKCYDCGLRMLVNESGMCPICGQFIMNWIRERVQSDTLKPDHAEIVVEYFKVNRILTTQEVRRALFLPTEGRHQSAHGRHRGHGKRKIRKVQRNRPAGWHGKHPEQKPRDRFSRESIAELPLNAPTEAFLDLFRELSESAHV